MGAKLKLNVSEHREAVLSLLRREGPAVVPLNCCLNSSVEAAKRKILCLFAFGSLLSPTTWRAGFIKSHAEGSLGESVIHRSTSARKTCIVRIDKQR